MNLKEKTDLDRFIEQAQELIEWLLDNPLEEIHLFEEKANQYAILTVKISNYYLNNKLKV